jgi:polysaccharide export outer membrane protein
MESRNQNIRSGTFGLLFLILIVAACGISGDVVKTTIVDGSKYKGLAGNQKARLEEIRKGQGEKKNENLNNVIRTTPNYTVAQYLGRGTQNLTSHTGDYQVGGYDVLRIQVYNETELSSEAVRVSAEGDISFPLIGRMKVAGLTISEIENLISEKLAQGQYLLDAHVSVIVTEYNSKQFIVLGAVEQPGSYSLRARERFLDAISRAGGIKRTKIADPQQAGRKGMIIRTEDSAGSTQSKIVINIDLADLLNGRDPASNIFLEDKDIVYIPPVEYFYIMGEVKNPGSFPLADGEVSLVEAISIAGGFTPIASRNHTRIIRIEDGVDKIIEVKVDAITKAGKKIHDIPIRPDDVIVVPQSFF